MPDGALVVPVEASQRPPDRFDDNVVRAEIDDFDSELVAALLDEAGVASLDDLAGPDLVKFAEHLRGVAS